MKVLVVCMLHAYGDPQREYSYEYFNFYQSLQQAGHEVELFDYMGELRATDRVEMNQKLLERVQEAPPDVVVFSLYTDQLQPETVVALREYTRTFCFFHDDNWRVDFSRFWARHFDCFSTSDIYGPLKYRELGLENAVYFPFGCNEQIFRPLNLPMQYDVSFVGGWHPYRAWIVERIRRAGIEVATFGYGWPSGEIDQEGMVCVFNQSRINLNLSNSAAWDVRYLLSSPRALINRVRSKKNVEQMKGRMFEVNGCAAFQLSYYVEGLANCYQPEQEIAIYSDVDDLIEKIRFYLAHEAQRAAIAQAGYARTLREHTFAGRFEQVFRAMRLPHGV